MLNIAVLVSGGGTNLQALIDAEKAGKIENGKISVVHNGIIENYLELKNMLIVMVLKERTC